MENFSDIFSPLSVRKQQIKTVTSIWSCQASLHRQGMGLSWKEGQKCGWPCVSSQGLSGRAHDISCICRMFPNSCSDAASNHKCMLCVIISSHSGGASLEFLRLSCCFPSVHTLLTPMPLYITSMTFGPQQATTNSSTKLSSQKSQAFFTPGHVRFACRSCTPPSSIIWNSLCSEIFYLLLSEIEKKKKTHNNQAMACWWTDTMLCAAFLCIWKEVCDQHSEANEQISVRLERSGSTWISWNILGRSFTVGDVLFVWFFCAEICWN